MSVVGAPLSVVGGPLSVVGAPMSLVAGPTSSSPALASCAGVGGTSVVLHAEAPSSRAASAAAAVRLTSPR